MSENLSCPHQSATVKKQVCAHLLEAKDEEYRKCFTAVGLNYDLLCSECVEKMSDVESPLCNVCPECFDEIQQEGYWGGIVGRPQILERSTDLFFTRWTVAIPELLTESIADIQPINTSSESLWIALTKAGRLLSVNLSQHTTSLIAQLPSSDLNLELLTILSISADGRYAAIVNTFGQFGMTLDLKTGHVVMPLSRDNYCIYATPFPVAFFSSDDRHYLIHGTAWNRLDVSDAETGALLTERGPTVYRNGEQRPAHYLDYFHGRLSVSPEQCWVADNGWIWHPLGAIETWNLKRWVEENVWESEDGQSKKTLCYRDYYWDGPLCWIDSQTLAVWGYGNDDEWLIPAVRLFDVPSGNELRWFAGPEVEFKEKRESFVSPFDCLEFDGYLFSFSEKHGASVWDVETGERLLLDTNFWANRYHRGAKQFLSLAPDGTIQLSRLEGR